MSARNFIYGLWCLAVLGLFLASVFYAWSPFADAGRGGRSYAYAGGPRHK